MYATKLITEEERIGLETRRAVVLEETGEDVGVKLTLGASGWWLLGVETNRWAHGYIETLRPAPAPVEAVEDDYRQVRTETPAPEDGEKVDVMCWCEKQVVKVPIEDVRKGLTMTCGREDC